MLFNKYVDNYIKKYDNGELVFNENRKLLIEWLRREILPRDDIYYFNDELIENYITFSETWFFELDEWEKFIASFVFLFYKERKKVVFRIFILIIARGAGKNGFITTIALFLISSLHAQMEYGVTIVANSEDQAKVSFEEAFNTIVRNESLSAIKTRDTLFDKGNNPKEPDGEFEPWKSRIYSRETQSELKFATSNADTKDGGRQGAIIYDEFHQFENSDLVDVLAGGLGKKFFARQFFIGTKGFIRDGYFDKMYERSVRILKGEIPFNGLFPWICELDDISEMDNEAMWEKANPTLQKPLTDRAENLLDTMRDEYIDLIDEPSKRPAFVTKRMNVIEGDSEHSVASREELLATNRPFFDLDGLKPIGSLDYGSVRDFAACGLLFKKGEEYAFKTHSFAIKHFVDVHYGYSNSANSLGGSKKAPIKAWEKQGLMSVIDEPSLDPMHIVEWFVNAREKYGVERIVADNFKLDILRPLLEKEGFEVDLIKRPQSIHPLVAPRIEDGFANNKIIFEDNPLMRWYTNNVYVKETSNGKIFDKKEEVKRKTDGFQALVHAMYRANELDDQTDLDEFFDMVSQLQY